MNDTSVSQPQFSILRMLLESLWAENIVQKQVTVT